jgi:phosphoserine phosphatase
VDKIEPTRAGTFESASANRLIKEAAEFFRTLEDRDDRGALQSATFRSLARD